MLLHKVRRLEVAGYELSNLAQCIRGKTSENIIIIIIVIAFKGLIRDFYNPLTAPRTVSNTYAQVAMAKSCANHVQHIERLSRAACPVTCHVV